jgi:hypothetical protein
VIADGECDFWEAGERREANGGDSTWRQWPILLIALALGLVRLPLESKASEETGQVRMTRRG